MTKAAIFFDCLPAVASVAQPMQIACVIGAASIAGHDVVEVETGLVWPSASRTGRVRVRDTQRLPIGAIATLARAGSLCLPSLLAGAESATGNAKAAWAYAGVLHAAGFAAYDSR